MDRSRPDPDTITHVGAKVADFLRRLPEVETVYRASCQEDYEVTLSCGTEITVVLDLLDVAARDARDARTF